MLLPNCAVMPFDFFRRRTKKSPFSQPVAGTRAYISCGATRLDIIRYPLFCAHPCAALVNGAPLRLAYWLPFSSPSQTHSPLGPSPRFHHRRLSEDVVQRVLALLIGLFASHYTPRKAGCQEADFVLQFSRTVLFQRKEGTPHADCRHPRSYFPPQAG